MPELSGIDVGVKLRSWGSDAPIIYLHHVAGLRGGFLSGPGILLHFETSGPVPAV